MFIEKLQLKNYGIYKNTTFEFQNGFNILSGANGNGKSHVIRAINYALLNKTFGKIEDDCNWDADSFYINLIVYHQNHKFDIRVTYGRKEGASKELWIDKEYYKGSSDVNNALAQYFDPALTQAGIMSLQGKMDVVDASDSERRENLKRIYDLDFTKQIDQLKDELVSIEEHKSEIDKQIYSLQNKDYTLQPLKETILTEEGYKNKKKELENLRNEKALYEEKVKIQKELVDRKESIKDQYDKVVQKGDKLDEEKENKEAEIEYIKKQKEHARDEHEQNIKNIQDELNNITIKRVPKFDEGLFKETEKEKNELWRQLQNINEKLELIDKGVCPTCGREFHINDKKEYENTQEQTKQNYDRISITYETLLLEKEKVEDQKEEQEENKRRKKELEKELERIEENYELKLNNIDSKIHNLQETIQDYDIRIQEYIEEEKRLNTELNEVNEKISEPIEERNFDTPIQNLEREIKQHENRVQENKMIEENNKKIQEQAEEDKKKLDELQKENDEIDKKIDLYKKGVDILRKDFPNYVIGTMVSELEEGMNTLLEKAYNNRYGVKVKESKRGLSVVYGPNEKDIKLASGGEKNLFNIGFKNAFSEIAGLHMLILDEALNFADQEIAQETVKTLNDLYEDEKIEQILMITHKDELKETIEGDYKGKIFTIQEGEIA